MALRLPRRTRATIMLDALTLRSPTLAAPQETTSKPPRDEKRGARFVIHIVAVLALMLVLGPLLPANASTTTPTRPGTGTNAEHKLDGGSFANFAVDEGKGGLMAMHNELLGTDPPDRAQLSTSPARVTLIFDLPAQRGFSTVVVTGPDGHQWQAGPATEEGTKVVAPVHPLGPAGDYTVAWRIVSADGHPVRGTFQFILTTPGTGTTTAAAAPPAPGRATPATRAGTAPMWPWMGGLGALLVIGVVLALRASRARRS